MGHCLASECIGLLTTDTLRAWWPFSKPHHCVSNFHNNHSRRYVHYAELPILSLAKMNFITYWNEWNHCQKGIRNNTKKTPNTWVCSGKWSSMHVYVVNRWKGKDWTLCQQTVYFHCVINQYRYKYLLTSTRGSSLWVHSVCSLCLPGSSMKPYFRMKTSGSEQLEKTGWIVWSCLKCVINYTLRCHFKRQFWKFIKVVVKKC